MKNLLEASRLRTNKLSNFEEIAYLSYDDSFDALTLMFVPPNTETIVHYLDSHVGILYEPASLEIVGFQIEAFEKSFLPQHADVMQAWKLDEGDGQSKDFGELAARIERVMPRVAQAVINASHTIFSTQGFSDTLFSRAMTDRELAVI